MSDQLVIDAMVSYGGSFIKALARAFQAADADNFERLRLAFNKEWHKYDAMARATAGREEAA